jgi:gas vesicle protein
MKKAFYLILAGVAIGILIAPRKGSETWQKLMDGFDDWKDNAQDRIKDLASQGKDAVEKGRVIVHDVADSTADKW